MKLILHIGTEKTGTSSIQQFLKINRELLSSKNILVPKTIDIGNGNHRWASIFANDNDYEDDFTKREFQNNRDLKKELIDEKLKELKKEIIMSDANICIISSEHLSSRLKKIENIDKLKQLFNRFFDEISIILYIRNPIEAAISLLSTQILSGYTPKGLNLKSFSNHINNLTVIKNWENIFSKNNLILKLFNEEDFINGDLIKDFCSSCNIKLSEKFQHTKRFNEKLNLDQMKFLKYLNQYIPVFIDNKLNKKRINLTKFIITNLKSSNYFMPTKQEYELFEKHFTNDNNYIKKKYFPDKIQLWSTYKKGFHEQENIINTLSEKEIEFLDSIKELCLKNNSEIEFLDSIKELWLKNNS